MQNIRTRELETGTIEELERRIPPQDRGPVFHAGEVVPLKGYGYKIIALSEGTILLAPHGPLPKKRHRRMAKGKKP